MALLLCFRKWEYNNDYALGQLKEKPGEGETPGELPLPRIPPSWARRVPHLPAETFAMYPADFGSAGATWNEKTCYSLACRFRQ
jgi:hypothetical protein